MGISLQATLFDSRFPRIDSALGGMVRTELSESAWVDHRQGWLSGSDVVFELLAERANWRQRDRLLFDRQVKEPRLSASWLGEENLESAVPALREIRLSLSAHYGVGFDSGSLNLYRDGSDGVAWHRDKIPSEIVDPLVAIVSVGEPRRLLLRPRGGGRSIRFELGRGDLLVTGGSTQRSWEHCVPKVASAGPRISIMLRHTGPRTGFPVGHGRPAGR